MRVRAFTRHATECASCAPCCHAVPLSHHRPTARRPARAYVRRYEEADNDPTVLEDVGEDGDPFRDTAEHVLIGTLCCALPPAASHANVLAGARMWETP